MNLVRGEELQSVEYGSFDDDKASRGCVVTLIKREMGWGSNLSLAHFYLAPNQLKENAMKNSRSWIKILLPWMLVTVFMSGCIQVKLVSDYDEQIDRGVTNIQKQVEAILTKIEKSAADPSAGFVASDYSTIKEELGVLLTRAKATDHNELTIKQLYTLGYALLGNPPLAPENFKLKPPTIEQSLEKRNQRKDPLSAGDIRDLRDLLDVNFRAILKFELAKKRGINTNSGTQ